MLIKMTLTLKMLIIPLTFTWAEPDALFTLQPFPSHPNWPGAQADGGGLEAFRPWRCVIETIIFFFFHLSLLCNLCQPYRRPLRTMRAAARSVGALFLAPQTSKRIAGIFPHALERVFTLLSLWAWLMNATLCDDPLSTKCAAKGVKGAVN